MFQTVPLPITRSFFTVPKATHTGLLTACEKTCMTYTIAVCTVKNS